MSAPTIEAEISAFAIDLDPRQSQRIIERALRSQSEISLWPNTHVNDEPLVGPLAGQTRDGLVVNSQAVQSHDRLPMISEYCEASFRLDESRLMFTTNVLDLSYSGDIWRVEIARPECLQMVQRRRYQRRELRDSIVVEMTIAGRGESIPVRGALLNVGAGGLSCRVEQAAAGGLSLDETVTLSFSLPESHDRFVLSGRIRGKTRGADREQLLLAIEFDCTAGQRDQIERLSEALYAPLAVSRG
jgi:c-di-GMP-binding flagellar brake protein YcgR